NARPDGDAVARLRIAQDAGSTQPVRIMAMPAPTGTPPAAPAQNPASTAPGAQEPARPTLLFDDVLRSVEDRFPLILAVEEEIAIAEGKLQSARGGFDVRAKAESDYAVEGFYDTEYQRFSIEQPTTFLGATLVGGYKLGNGNFPEWDGDFETNGDGEVSAGVVVPLLAGRDIDGRRLALWQARVAREQADPEILAKRLEVTRKAAAAYWKWVAAGQKLRVFQRLLALAEDRQTRVQQLVDAGEFAPITVDDNRRLVVERQGLVIIAERGLQEAAINLS
ncbi:MAG: TolC family protein, partial [Planctomycetota bacterium]